MPATKSLIGAPVQYWQENPQAHLGAPPVGQTLYIVGERPDGTVDLARANDGTAHITECKLVDAPAVGSCSLG